MNLGPKVSYNVCPDHVVSLIRDSQCLVLKQSWYSLHQHQRNEKFEWTLTSPDLNSGSVARSQRWHICQGSDKQNLISHFMLGNLSFSVSLWVECFWGPVPSCHSQTSVVISTRYKVLAKGRNSNLAMHYSYIPMLLLCLVCFQRGKSGDDSSYRQ